MIKVLFVNPFSELSGPEHVILRLMRGLDRDRFSAGLVCPSNGHLARAAKSDGIDVQFVPLRIARFSLDAPGQAWRLLAVAGRLSAIIRAGHYDVVHVNSHRVGLHCSFAARLAGAVSVWHIHEIYQTSKIRRALIVGLARRSADALVAVSDAVADQFRPCAKLSRIYNGVDWHTAPLEASDGNEVRRELGFSIDDIVVGCMGRLSRQKGQDVFLQAAARIAGAVPRVRFIVAGDEALGEVGFREHLVQLAGKLGLAETVVFTGYRSDAAAVMAAMDVFVHPTVIPDSLPNVILEAMALGKPVVATATGGSPELVVDGETGFLVPPLDADGLAAKIGTMLGDAKLRDSLGKAALNRVATHFGYRAHVERFERLYEQLIDSRGRG